MFPTLRSRLAYADAVATRGWIRRPLLVVTGAVLIAGLVATPAAAVVRTCDGEPATIQRGDADNDIVGTNGNDVIVAGGGDDGVQGGLGRDRICGEDGNDLMYGEGGSDFLVAGDRGRDSPIGGDGNDGITRGRGDDSGTVPFRDGTLARTTSSSVAARTMSRAASPNGR
jgi:Ca2+-binding RTX toxin-like protein